MVCAVQALGDEEFEDTNPEGGLPGIKTEYLGDMQNEQSHMT